MCSPRENARRIVGEMAVAALTMAEMAENRFGRLESDVAHIGSDVADLKVDVRELRKEIGGTHQKIDDLRDDVHKEIRGLHEKAAGLRDDLHKEIRGLHEKVADLRDDMRKGFSIVGRSNMQTRIWMLLIGGAILGVMAHAVHWL